MGKYLEGLTEILIASANNRKNQKVLQRVHETNELNRGIVRYQPSQIEAFFEETVPVENMLISGGINSIRVRAILRVIECAYIQGFSVLVLHCGDKELENGLNGYFDPRYICLINRNRPFYDPFVGASNAEVARLVLSSATNHVKINSTGRYYLNGVSDYIRCNHKTPSIYMFVNCPYLTFIDGVNRAEQQGRISANDANMILSQIIQGETERGSIENFFHELAMQGNGILVTKQTSPYAVSLVQAAAQQQILSVDIKSGSNSLLLNMLLNETETVLSQGSKMLIVIDNIRIDTSELLKKYVLQGDNNNVSIISSDDVFSNFGGQDSDFFSYVGRCSKMIISKHVSGYSCQKLSDAIGYYDKQEIERSYTQNSSYHGRWGIGSSLTSDILTKRENIVKAEELQKINYNDIYIYDKYSDELAFTTVI